MTLVITFCIQVPVLPGAGMTQAQTFSARVNEGLADAAGAGNRFSFKLEIVNYPEHASTATELEDAVVSLMPADNVMRGMPGVFASIIFG